MSTAKRKREEVSDSKEKIFNNPEYIPEVTFTKKHLGYVFKLGDKGLGYYLDGNIQSLKVEGFVVNDNEEIENGNSVEATKPKELKLVKIDICDTLNTLSKHFKNIKKLSKAVQLTTQLLETSINKENSSIFFNFAVDLNQENVTPFNEISNKLVRDASVQFYSVYYIHIQNFSEEEQYQIINWYLNYAIKSRLQTDDTYEFASNMKQLLEIVERTPGICDEKAIARILTSSSEPVEQNVEDNLHDDPVEIKTKTLSYERLDIILACMETAYRNYHWAWAKLPTDKVFAAAASRRLSFPMDLREKLDELTTRITLEQRKAASGAGSIHTLRTYDSTAHPLHQKRVGILR